MHFSVRARYVFGIGSVKNFRTMKPLYGYTSNFPIVLTNENYLDFLMLLFAMKPIQNGNVFRGKTELQIRRCIENSSKVIV